MVRWRGLASLVAAVWLTAPLPARADEVGWRASWRLDIHLNYRDSNDERFRVGFPFDPIQLPVGQDAAFMRTVDAGSHWEASLVSLILDLEHGRWFAARAKIDGIDLYERNPTSTDRTIDLDEAWIRFGEKPERLALPSGTSLFILAGKAPKMERQPVRLLESYGLASTAFSRLEDVQVQVGGSFGRHLYWRAQVSSGNPLFIRDSNALAGDHGIRDLLAPNPDPKLRTGFPILYDAEVEDYFLDTENAEVGGALGVILEGVRGQWAADLMAYHYERKMADSVELRGTFYGGDLDILDAGPFRLPFVGRDKTESGARLYAEWKNLSVFANWVRQDIAGLGRKGWEVEAGWDVSLRSSIVPWIRPAARYSELDNDFRGPPQYPAPSVWWDWAKVDAGVRLGIYDRADLTIEYSRHDVKIPVKLDLDELLVTLRIRLR